MPPAVFTWISEYGSLALFGLLAVGVFGVPVPDETLLVVAGTLVAKGDLAPAPTIVAAVLGASAGITLSFTVGRLLGPPAVHRFGRLAHVSDATLARVERWFERIGKWTLTFGYYVPGVRHLTALVAGASGLPAVIFAGFAYAGALLWSVTFLALGYEVGDAWPLVLAAFHRHLAAGGIAAGLVLLAWWGWWKRRGARTDRG